MSDYLITLTTKEYMELRKQINKNKKQLKKQGDPLYNEATGLYMHGPIQRYKIIDATGTPFKQDTIVFIFHYSCNNMVAITDGKSYGECNRNQLATFYVNIPLFKKVKRNSWVVCI